MSEGWIALHRGWRDSPIFRGEFSRADAWVWLIEQAAWKPTRTRIKGETIDLQRGELSFSQRFLAEKWGWSKSRVDRFIAELRDESMIETRSKNGATADHAAGQGQCIISICNYRKYQDIQEGERGNGAAACGASAGQQRGKEEQGNKGTGLEEPSGSSLSAREQVDQVFDAWNAMAKANRLAVLRQIGADRRRHCHARLREYGLEAVLAAIEKIPASSFLRGDTGNWSGATIKFFLRPDTVNNILEGNYDDRPKQPGPPYPQSGDRRDGVAKALDRRLGLGEPSGASGRCDAGTGGDDRALPAPRLAVVR